MTETDELEDLIEATANAGKIKAKTYGNEEVNDNNNLEQKPHLSFFKKFLIISFIIFLVLLLSFIFWPRRPPRSPYLPIPYIFNYNFKKTILHYISLPSHNQIFVVAGPPGLGKTRGLTEISDKFLNNSKNLPISFDFAKITQFSSSNDIKNFLLSSVLKSFITNDKQVNLTEVKRISPFLDTIQLNNFQNMPIKLKDQTLKKIYILLNQTLKEGSEAEYQQFFYLLDKFSNFLHIVIFANDPFRFQPFINFCHRYSSNLMNMGIIFDIDNIYQTDILSSSNPDSKSIYRIYFLSEFDENAAKTILVDKEYVFNKKTFPKLWNAFGGKGKYWAQYHDAIREGYSQNDAINLIQNKLATRFIHATSVNATRRVYYNRVSFLKKIIRKNENAISNEEIPIIAHYNEWGLLAPTEPNKILLTDKIKIAAIKKALKSL